MQREARRMTRTAVSLTHILIQLVLFWLVLEESSNIKGASTGDPMKAVVFILVYLAGMLGVFFIKYSAMKLLSHTHSGGDR